jgi:hypothetical protein
MAYTINKTSGTVLANVADGTIDSSTADLTLIGKNYSGYGDALNENFVKLLENFSNTTAPSSPLAGQLWWDSTNNLLKVYTGSTFKTVSSSTASASQPASGVVGDLWWDTANTQLKVYNGATWTLVGPAFSSGAGQSGPVVESVNDGGGTAHVIVKIMISDVIVAIVSKDTAFTPSPAISGFGSIAPGYNLSTAVTNNKLTGTATDADALGGQAATSYLRSDANDTTTGTLGVLNDSGVTVGADNDLTLTIASNDVTIKNNTSDGDLILGVNDGGTPKSALTIDGATGEVLVLGAPTQTLGVATKAYVDGVLGSSGTLASDGSVALAGDLLPDANNTRDLGSSGTKFAEVHATTFHGQSTSAQYADLAERFASDNTYTPGTVVALGGAKEITRVNEDASSKVFGVISTSPAYLMNAGAGTEETHPAVAIQGRVPVMVVGTVNKGDRLISAGNGVARAGNDSEINAFNTIGRALENKYTEDEGTVLCFVKVN